MPGAYLINDEYGCGISDSMLTSAIISHKHHHHQLLTSLGIDGGRRQDLLDVRSNFQVVCCMVRSRDLGQISSSECDNLVGTSAAPPRAPIPDKSCDWFYHVINLRVSHGRLILGVRKCIPFQCYSHSSGSS